MSSLIKSRRRIKNANGDYDIVYHETSADLVRHNDGNTAADHMDGTVASADGAHGFRYNETDQAFETYDPVSGTWSKTKSPLLAKEYSSESTYELGDYCILDGKLYMAIQFITVAEEWTSDHWVETTVANELYKTSSALSTKVNPNLLDNWYFGNPVNQSGQTSYAAMGYTVDRWKNSSGNTSVLVTDSGLTMVGGTAYLTQKIEDGLLSELDGKIITMSSLWTDNVLQTFTWVLNKSQYKKGDNSLYVYTPNDGFFVSRYIGESQKTVKAAKLELGTQQTLAHQDENGVWQLNEIPDYGEQLARCQRYFQKYDNHIWFILCKDNVWRTNFTFPVAMREAPTVEFETISDLSANVVFDNRTKNGISGYASSSANYIAVKNLTLNANL